MATSKSPFILITGATGNVGSELVKSLSAKGVPFRALVRSREQARELASLKGAELVVGDFTDAESIRRALAGIERTFLLTHSSEQAQTWQSNFVELAQQAGVQHIVKLSQFAADPNSPVRFLRYHAAVEQKIKDSGMAYTFLRPNLYMQGLLGFREPIAQQGKFFASVGEAKVSVVDVRDIAAVSAEALTDHRHEWKTYDITGPEALTHSQMAEYLSNALGRSIQFVNVPPESMKQALVGVGFPVWQADGLLEDYAHYARGEAAAVSATVQEVTGKSARDFNGFARDYAPAFSGPAI